MLKYLLFFRFVNLVFPGFQYFKSEVNNYLNFNLLLFVISFCSYNNGLPFLNKFFYNNLLNIKSQL